MPDKELLRRLIRDRLGEIATHINDALRGKRLESLRQVLARIGRGGALPHWYEELERNGSLPNLDGKTVGSVVEMLLVAVLETVIFRDLNVGSLRINPARGVDLPDLNLGVKSPSENYCTSEPFFSAYARLLGSEFDILVLLTDYQSAKRSPPLRLQIINWRYLDKTQVADRGLCRLARMHRDWLLQENEPSLLKLFRFLAYVNQSDWRAKFLLRFIENMRDEAAVQSLIRQARRLCSEERCKRQTRPAHAARCGTRRNRKNCQTIAEPFRRHRCR